MSKRGKKPKEDSAIAEEVLSAFGLGGLLRAVSKSPAFQERLKEVDRQIEDNLRKGVATRRHFEVTGRSSFTVQPLIKKEVETRKVGPVEVREALVDIFDEQKNLRIVIELPDAKEKDIEIKAEDRILIISAGAYHKKIALPCEVSDEVKKTYKNNILEIKLKKK